MSKKGALTCSVAAGALLWASAAWAQQDNTGSAAPQDIETVVVTGSLIHGAAAVGAPATSLTAQNFSETGAVNLSEVFVETPGVQLLGSTSTAAQSGNTSHGESVNIHGLNGNYSSRTLLLIDGLRIPPQNQDESFYDPSMIPILAVDHVDVLMDGASATYGSDAVAGVVNVGLKHDYEGAQTLMQLETEPGMNGVNFRASQLLGTSWDTGNVTFTYEYDNSPPLLSSARSYYTFNFTPYGVNNLTPLSSAVPGIVSTGKPSSTSGAGCTNCYSAPKGTNGQGLTWAQFLANPGTGNEVNPYSFGGDAIPTVSRNAAVLTVDQQVMPGIQFFAEGFFSARRTRSTLNDGTIAVSSFFTDPLPTSNPYYPVGAPAGLQVSTTLDAEAPGLQNTLTQVSRAAGGFNLDLPFGWKGKLTASNSDDLDTADDTNIVKANNVSAVLGNTISVAATLGVNSAYTYTKPANVPYLNPFCDPRTVANCVSPTTQQYIMGFRDDYSNWVTNEYSSVFDGPLFDFLGAGPVRAAVGASFDQDSLNYSRTSNYSSASNAIIVPSPTPGRRSVWAGFLEINAPIIGPANALPLIESLTLQASIRHDQYTYVGTQVGGTTNPKVSVDWVPIDGLKLSGTWGTSFMAPAFVQIGDNIGPATKSIYFGENLAGGATANGTAACTVIGGTPTPGSAAAFLNPNCTAALQYPGGVQVGSSAAAVQSVGLSTGKPLQPEKAQNLSAGFDFAPHDYLPGLDLQATYWFVKIRDVLTTGCTDLNNAACSPFIATAGNTPNFASIVAAVLANPANPVPPTTPAGQIAFLLNDGTVNLGSLTKSGIDFSGKYERDMGDWGIWRIGLAGTAYLDDTTWDGLGSASSDFQNPLYGNNTTAGIGNPTAERLVGRGNLGWTNGTLDIALFANYQDHYYVTDQFPASYLAANPNYNPDRMPSYYTFDLSVRYNLGDVLKKYYLNGLSLQLTVENLFDRDPLFEYNDSSNDAKTIGLSAANSAESPEGRVIGLQLIKSW